MLFHRPRIRVSLRWMLTLPFILQVTFMVVCVGYVTRRNGQRSIEDLTQQLITSVSQQVEQKLITYLDAPILANQYHRDAVKQGTLSLDLSQRNPQREQYLWQQMQLFPSFTWISLGSEQGDSAGIWRSKEKAPLQMTISNASTQYFGNYYATQAPGTIKQKVKTEPPAYDPRIRPWYKVAIEAQDTVWSPVYAGFSQGTIFIASSQPLYNSNNKLVGVSGIDISLSEIQNFLSKIKIPGQIFVMERSGLLVSSSSDEKPFRIVDGKPERIQVLESKTPLIQDTSRSILKQVNNFKTIQKSQSFYFQDQNQGKLEGKFVRVLPFSRGKGLDWLIVIVVPESIVMAEVVKGDQWTIVFCLIALILIILLNTLIAQRLVRPISRLSQASKGIAQGNFSERLKMPRILELSTLTSYFNQMSQELQTTRQQLDDYARSLEQKVADRTRDLQAEIDRRAQAESALKNANQKLKRLAYLDGLTQIPNRRSFDTRLTQEWLRGRRNQQYLSIVICDVDYFKKFNDTYGHQLGDDCLCAVAQAIAAVVRRPSDLVARYGGEEFIMLLPDTDKSGAMTVAESMRSQIKSLSIAHSGSEISRFVTMSFGVATLIPSEDNTAEQLVHQADQALYQAKQQGRDRISN